MTTRDPNCPLCQTVGGTLLWQGPHMRVIEVEDAQHPGFTRVVWSAHLAEMTNLSTHGRDLLMRAVYTVEEAQHSVLGPDKVNLASLGNMVAHLHWHVIPRWRLDPHFPGPIWAPEHTPDAGRSAQWAEQHARIIERLPRYRDRLVEGMDALLWH